MRAKIEYMDCNFSGDVQRNVTLVKIEDEEISKKDFFQFFSNRISKDGEIEEDVEYWIRAGWLK